ncbi:FtsK/SpoIIIE domain-containing protein [Micromonospora echinospora]|uniref:FtsK/SpoIIIE domain-containing protein n=1 Tax=Micromonospora echinospora TaxID=1877 RepID=UPI0037A6DA7C
MEREIRIAVGGREVPMVVRAGARATVADLVAAIDRALPDAGAGPVAPVRLWLRGRPLSRTARLADLPLPAGSRIEVAARPGDTGSEPVGAVELAVVGGAGGVAATSFRSGSDLTVGRSPEADLVLTDPEVSRVHARLTTGADGAAELTDAGSRNGTAWRGVRLDAPTPVAPGDVFGVGETVLTLRPVDPADAPVAPVDATGTIRYNRPPRIAVRVDTPRLTVPRRPEPPRTVRFPLLAILLPVLLAGVAYAIFPNAGYLLLFMALSPLLLLANVFSDRRGGRKEYRQALADYERQRTELAERLDRLAEEQGRTRREELPDPGRLLRTATAPTRRLFERRPTDVDFLRLRVGLAATLVEATLTGPGAELDSTAEPLALPAVAQSPVAVDLTVAGVLGLAGPRPGLLATVRAVLAQIATLHAPHDLGVVLLTGGDEADDWAWLSWLPHTLPHTADLECDRMVATDAEQARARLAGLRRIVDQRRAERAATLRAGAPAGRRLVLVADGARRLRGLPGLAELLADGPEVGVYAICLDALETELPGECRATVVVNSGSGTRAVVRRPEHPDVDGVLLDRLDAGGAARVGYALAPLRVLGERWGEGGGVPETVRLLELAGLGRTPGPAQIRQRWAAEPAGRSTRLLLGVGPDGPITVDLRRDGPHALIAGTSGAGKSELLQTLVTGLALGNTPDALSLVLVDYKGGSAFAECAQLPHCVGMVTDLDGHLVNRALAALRAELRRREALLAEAAAKDIEDYWAITGGRLPRLVIVIDEFASLVEEVPEFVSGVVGIGMRGRSLGVHVVMATQRPAGSVNAELRANLNLRICLRVTSAADSADVVDVPDAARLSRHQPGRAYLRAGHSDLTLVQTARIGWPRAAATAEPTSVALRPRRVRDLGRGPVPAAEPPAGPHGPAPVDGATPPAGSPAPGATVPDQVETDLTVLVAAIREAAEAAGIRTPDSPWLPPLPELVVDAELPGGTGGGALAAPIGLADHPEQQAQRPYLLDLERTGPVLVAGMARSGRSTLLRALVVGLTRRSGPADLHLYLLDQGNRALAPLSGLPHCGAYVDGDDSDRTTRVLTLLDAEIGRRQRLLASGGYAALAEQRAAVADTEALPYLVLVLDRYETFVARYGETDGGRLVDLLDSLLRRGPAVGVVTVLATDRSGFTHRLAGAVATRLILAHADPDDLSAYGINPREAPRTMPPGRAIGLPGNTMFQVALLDPDPDGTVQAAAAQRHVAATRSRWDGLPVELLPQRVDPLPVTITAAEVDALRRGPLPTRPTVGTVGVGGDHLGPVDVDLAELGHTFLVAGAPGTGRSGALLALADSLLRRPEALPVVALCPRPSPVQELAGRPGVAAVLTGARADAELAAVLADLPGPVTVLVDDAELLADGSAAHLLEDLARQARDTGNLLLAAGTTDDLVQLRYRGWLARMCRAQAGLLLNPVSHVDGDLFEVKLPRSTCGAWPPGRGLLMLRRRASQLQIPLPELAVRG